MTKVQRDKLINWLYSQSYVSTPDTNGDYLLFEDLVKYLPNFIETLINDEKLNDNTLNSR